MSAAPSPEDYPFRSLFISQDRDGPTRVLTLDADAEPTALLLDLFRDCIEDQAHVLFAARSRAALALATAAFKRLVEQSPIVN